MWKMQSGWLCKYSTSSRQLLIVTTTSSDACLEDKFKNRKNFDLFDVYCIGQALFVNKISSVEDMMAVERRRRNFRMKPIKCVAQVIAIHVPSERCKLSVM